MSNASSGASRRKHSGRRPGGADTRAEILAAARGRFAEQGFDRATIRRIAAEANVDPALVLHYFGSKEKLFVASIELAVNPAEAIPALLAGDPDGLGERVARFFLGLWEDPTTRQALAGTVRAAVSHEQAAGLLREFLGGEIFGRLAVGLEGEDAERRAALAGAQLVGLALARYLVGVEALADADLDTIVAAVSPTIQRYLVG